MRPLMENGNGTNAPPPPNAVLPGAPPNNVSPFSGGPQSTLDASATMAAHGLFAAMDDFDRLFLLPADGPGVASALDESGVAVLQVPAAGPATAVAELVPVSGSTYDSVVVLSNVPEESGPAPVPDRVPQEEHSLATPPGSMVPAFRLGAPPRKVVAGGGKDEGTPPAEEPQVSPLASPDMESRRTEESESHAEAAVVPAVFLASYFAREWLKEERAAREFRTSGWKA